MKVVVAMDSFKNSMTAVTVCRIVADSIVSIDPETEVVLKPMADGGEGTARAMMTAGQGQWIERTVIGPLPDMHVEAGFAWLERQRVAVVEMAQASGLQLLSPKRMNPLRTTTYGTGELIRAATELDPERILLAVGGSATVDGGVGAAAALGWRFLDDRDQPIEPAGGQLARIRRIVPPAKPFGTAVQVLCDVDNPLCGEHGAARIYGPQKGATAEMVETLEAGLVHLARLVKAQLGSDLCDLPGAGAAGGLAGGAVAFMDAQLVSGIDTVMAQSGLAQALGDADWVITGEGCFDSQSLRGKVVSGISRLAREASTQVAVLAGQVCLDRADYTGIGVVDALGCMDGDVPLEYALENAPSLLAEIAKRFARRYLSRDT